MKTYIYKIKKVKMMALFLGIILTLPYPYAFADDPAPTPPEEVPAPIQIINPVTPIQAPIVPLFNIPSISTIPSIPNFFTGSPLSNTETPTSSDSVNSSAPNTETPLVPTTIETPSISNVPIIPMISSIAIIPTIQTLSTLPGSVGTVSNIPSVPGTPSETNIGETSSIPRVPTIPTIPSLSLIPSIPTAITNTSSVLEETPTTPAIVNNIPATTSVNAPVTTSSQTSSPSSAIEATRVHQEGYLSSQALANHLEPPDKGTTPQVGRLGSQGAAVFGLTAREKALLIQKGLMSQQEADRAFRREIRMPATAGGKVKTRLRLYYISDSALGTSSQAVKGRLVAVFKGVDIELSTKVIPVRGALYQIGRRAQTTQSSNSPAINIPAISNVSTVNTPAAMTNSASNLPTLGGSSSMIPAPASGTGTTSILNIPHIPAITSIPSIPTLPSIPSISESVSHSSVVSLPTIPTISHISTIPTLPNIPSVVGLPGGSQPTGGSTQPSGPQTFDLPDGSKLTVDEQSRVTEERAPDGTVTASFNWQNATAMILFDGQIYNFNNLQLDPATPSANSFEIYSYSTSNGTGHHIFAELV